MQGEQQAMGAIKIQDERVERAFEQFSSSSHFPSLNGIRLISAMAVIKEHTGLAIGGLKILNFGWLGVDMFFVLSGFLIVSLLIRERQKAGDISLRKFYARRTLRIFPVYYFVVLTIVGSYLLISPWFPNGLKYYSTALPFLLTYTQDFVTASLGILNPTWSLAVEEQFYLVWPLVEKMLAGWRKWCFLALALAANQLVAFGAINHLISRVYGSEAATKLPIYSITFTPILLGVLLAHLLSRREIFSAIYRCVGNKAAPLAILLVLASMFQVFPEDIQGWPRLIVHMLMVLFVCSLVIYPDNCLRPLLDSTVMDMLGKISYGLYLYHMLVLTLFSALSVRYGYPSQNSLGMFVLTALTTIIVASASYRWIEMPFLRLKSRFSWRDTMPSV